MQRCYSRDQREGGEQFAVSASLVPVPPKSYSSHTLLHVELWGHLSHVSQYPPHPPLQLNISHIHTISKYDIFIDFNPQNSTCLSSIIAASVRIGEYRVNNYNFSPSCVCIVYYLPLPPRPVLCSFH